MKVTELSGALLDYWVARTDETWKRAHEMFPAWTLDPTFSGVELISSTSGEQECILIPNNPFRQDRKPFNPSSEWLYGGPIIERERITISPAYRGEGWGAYINGCCYESDDPDQTGPTPLIAAMRAYVASKFGDEVQDEVSK